ncbi:hypothetical protein DYE50_08640 [Treponema ruminis]|uniref:Divergent polysaccharide deacetylase n=1 Tax=Treponema ruminis TaxID=744515 RepID=A0A7W8G9R6_9SPIR|nr:divergent polysaccharide deacetylase family protein [Treponema ruminis]MBB5226463.1 hypothetical protein [Treponema ruminis]QSI02633.1 hypothetical protein DYE50_08640 [Treponema ruminis]
MPKKTVPAKKRKTSRTRAKKPKVKLAKNKVALFSGLVCLICVLAIGLSVLLNQGEKQNLPKTEVLAKAEPAAKSEKTVEKTRPEVKAEKAKTQEKKAAPKKEANTPKEEKKTQKTPAKKADSQKNTVVKEKSAPTIQPLQTQPVRQQEEKTVEKKNNKAEKKNSSSQPKIITKEMKESSAVKTLPSNHTSQAGNIQPQKNSGAQIASVMPPKEQETIQQNVPRNRFDIPPAAKGATIVIVIDDAGRSVENTRRYASLPFPITIAVLPKLLQSRACADAVRAAGKEVILHQPMQSMNLNLDPGPGKITADMNSYQIASIIKENLAELGPGVRGMNNHEGSLITANEIKIGAVLEVCAEKGIYFFDSRTTAETKAPQAALERDMTIFEKAGPYLDNDIDRAKMLERMRETLAYANRHGKALVIGHVDKSVKILPDLLAEMYPEMKAAGYRFATPSMLR